MSPAAFTLSVPADEPFRGLAADLVRAYLDLTGGTGSAAEAFTASVAEAVDRMAPHGTDVEVVVNADGRRIEVLLTCGHEHEALVFPAEGR